MMGPAPPNDITLQALADKRPRPAIDQQTPIDPTINIRYTSLQIIPEDVSTTLHTFSLGSPGEPYVLTPQHLIGLLAEDSDCRLLTAITDLVNIVLAGKLDSEINIILYKGQLIVLSHTDGAVRAIVAEFVLRRMAAICANSHVIGARSKVFQPREVGIGVAGGAQAAIDATRRYINQLSSGYAFTKLDFANALNTLRRGLLLDTVARNIPELYRFTLSTYASCEPALV